MALPSAPLGSLASLNIPSSIPVVQNEKKTKLWQQALAGILANAAGQVVSQGVGNTMAQDHAEEFGEKPTEGFESFWKGPKVNEKEAVRRRTEKKDDERSMANAKLQIGLRELEAQPSAATEMQKSENELNRLQSSINSNQQLRTGLQERRESNAAARGNNQDDNQVRLLLQQLQTAFQAPGELAKVENLGASTKNMNAEAQSRETMNQLQKKMLDGSQVGKDGKPVEAPATPRQQAVQGRLQDTSRYPTAEAMLSRTQPGTPSPTSAPPMNPYEDTGIDRSATEEQITPEQILQRITQRANEGSLPTPTSGVSPAARARAEAHGAPRPQQTYLQTYGPIIKLFMSEEEANRPIPQS